VRKILWLLDRCGARHISRFLLIFVNQFPSYTKASTRSINEAII